MKYLHCKLENIIEKNKVVSRETLILFFMTIAVLTAFFYNTNTANAGFFSSISSSIADEVSAQTKESNVNSGSQNMALLQPAINIEPVPKRSTDEAISTSGNALVAEIGPQGTISEIVDDYSTEISIYVVREGDTLSSIADLFNVSINTIVWANDISRNSNLVEGQKLVILPISGVKYTVKKGDTIKGIVLRYKANLDEVLKYNDITLSTTLKPGDLIIIPDAEPSNDGKSNKNTVILDNKVHDSDGPYYPGYFIRPIEGGKKSQGLHGFNAIDLAAPSGTIIRAAASGVVISSMKNGAWHGGYGNYVIISHPNGTQTLYAHTLKNFVSVGDSVVQGQMIAKVGNTGNSTGPHVHFEIRGAKNPF